jgi:hypothetical protein
MARRRSKMQISPVFFVIFGVLMIIAITYGLVSGFQMRRQLSKFNTRVPKQAVYYLVTEPCGYEGSKNSDVLFVEALKKQNSALPVTMKLIQKG